MTFGARSYECRRMTVAGRLPHEMTAPEEMAMRPLPTRHHVRRSLLAMAFTALAATAALGGQPQPRTFATPEDAAQELIDTVKAGQLNQLLALLGPESEELVSSSDPDTGRKNREVFLVAVAEGWRLSDLGPDRKELIVGHEDWPFPIPLVKEASGWRFDLAAGKEEVLARRIGRNELAAINVCRGYVVAQRAYATVAHDDKPAGVYARVIKSDLGKQNGLYWPAKQGAPRSPVGWLLASAGEDPERRATNTQPTPFHGYYFRILLGQGPAATGGAIDYVVNGKMSGGFALVAWPAQYDVTGVMTFIVNQDGVVYEKDLGPDTATTVTTITRYDPDSTWRLAQ